MVISITYQLNDLEKWHKGNTKNMWHSELQRLCTACLSLRGWACQLSNIWLQHGPRVRVLLKDAKFPGRYRALLTVLLCFIFGAGSGGLLHLCTVALLIRALSPWFWHQVISSWDRRLNSYHSAPKWPQALLINPPQPESPPDFLSKCYGTSDM